MAGEWNVAPLEELYEFSSGLSKPRSAFGAGYPFLSFKDVFYNIFVPEQLAELVQSTEQERERCSIKRGDVFLTRTSETMDELGMSCVSLRNIPDATFNGFTKRLRPKDGRKVAPEYAGYYFRSPNFRQSVTAMSSMSTRASLNNEMLARLSISLPTFEEQAAIGHVLGTLDDKIELNRRMNETLETMARALFKSWFVDFDPVRAKAEGRDPGLPKPLADLFPDSFEDSELGEIPRGWLIRKIESVCNTVTRGVTPKYEEGSRRYIINQRVNRGTYLDWAELKELTPTLDVPADRYAKRWDVLVNCLGEGTLGRVHLFKGVSDAYVIDQHMSICRGATPGAGAYIYQLLASPAGQERIESLKTGSTGMTMFNISKLRGFELLWPGDGLVAEYFWITQSELERAATSEAEAHTLASIRDTLLPKLMSGELRVEDPERFLGGGD